jgi:hypothetical protein
MSAEHEIFFRNDADRKSRRVELNAFTTEQLLEIIDDKLSHRNNLPKLDVSKALKADLTKIKEFAFFKHVRNKYEILLSGIDIPVEGLFDGGLMTYPEMMEHMPSIEKEIVKLVTAEIEKKEAEAI